MAGRYFGWMASGLFITGLLVYSTKAAVDPKDQGGKVNQKMVAAAKESMKTTQAIYEVGRASAEDVYRWSRRVVAAEQFSPEAVKAHLALMRGLHARAAAQRRVGAEGGEEHILHATEYYVAEAEGFGGT
jgi:hypothetical protein